MRDITKREFTSQFSVPNLNLTKAKRINLQISEPLLIKCQNLIKSKHMVQDYTYSSLSDLIRKSLQAYQAKKISLETPRPNQKVKKTIGLVLPLELWNYHQSLPVRHRTEIIELSLANYLNTI